MKRLGSLLKAVVDDYKRYQQQLKAGKGELKAVAEYKSLVFKKDELFDIFPRKTNGEDQAGGAELGDQDGEDGGACGKIDSG